MVANFLSKQDLASLEERGLRPEDLNAQLALFRKPPAHISLLRPCTIHDGIRVIGDEEAQAFIARHEEEARRGRSMKFVPASGAASRMFKDLLQCLGEGQDLSYDRLFQEAEMGRKEARACLDVLDGLERFAFFEDLRASLSTSGLDLRALLAEGKIEPVLRFLLLGPGLDYASLPKGLLKFHDYRGKSRTAFEEQLVEGAGYLADGRGTCPIHFTVSQEHLSMFESLSARTIPHYEKEFQVSYRVNFSIQKPSTDTIAVDLEGNPFRDSDARLLFRPGGHGALIENLNDLQADVIFIKNIDNVVPDRLKGPTVRWKKILGGYLVSLQDRIFQYLEALTSGVAGPSLLEEVIRFMEEKLSIVLPDRLKGLGPDGVRDHLVDRLNRPIRVCGMVKNEGEPGGGPFWVAEKSGETSLQIVEASQVDPDSREQQEILKRATHFNPVDLVCAVRDRTGRPFDLRSYVDREAVFMSKKSKDGRELRALELPGLWNGGMAGWITVFVEVPSVTFAPVKTVNDLLRSEHQPA